MDDPYKGYSANEIPEALYKHVQKEVVIGAERVQYGRSIVPLDINLTEKDSHESWKVADGKDASMGWTYADFAGGREVLNISKVDTEIPVIGQPWQMKYETYAQAMESGFDLMDKVSHKAGYHCGYGEDQLIFRGWDANGDATYEVNGLYAAAGNTYGTSKDFGTLANILAAIGGTIDLFDADSIHGPFHLVLATTQYNEYTQARDAAGTVKDQVAELLNPPANDEPAVLLPGGPGKVYKCPFLAAGTGMMIPAWQHDAFKYFVARDLTTALYPATNAPTSDIFLDAFIRGALIVWDSNAIATMTAI